MIVKPTELEGVFLIEGGQKFGDDRGFFRESFSRRDLEQAIGKEWKHVQENTAVSKQFVLRGIHAAPWSKLVYVQHGAVMAVIVDLRSDSPTFQKSIQVELSLDNGNKLFVPPGFGNSYFVLSDGATYEYQVDMYFKDCLDQGIKEIGVAFNDPELNIQWPEGEMITSEKDQQNPTVAELAVSGDLQKIAEWAKANG